jgi:uncharacterized membrane protein YeaQ/YmgE (transglycosylase-associated protein family)
MNLVLWILGGSALAWFAFSRFDYNRERGLFVAVLVGAAGAYFGGSILAPMLGSAADPTGDFRPLAFVVATVCAAGCLLISDMVYERFGM